MRLPGKELARGEECNHNAGFDTCADDVKNTHAFCVSAENRRSSCTVSLCQFPNAELIETLSARQFLGCALHVTKFPHRPGFFQTFPKNVSAVEMMKHHARGPHSHATCCCQNKGWGWAREGGTRGGSSRWDETEI